MHAHRQWKATAKLSYIWNRCTEVLQWKPFDSCPLATLISFCFLKMCDSLCMLSDAAHAIAFWSNRNVSKLLPLLSSLVWRNSNHCVDNRLYCLHAGPNDGTLFDPGLFGRYFPNLSMAYFDDPQSSECASIHKNFFLISP